MTNPQEIAIASLYAVSKPSADPQTPRALLDVAAYLVSHPRAYLFPDSPPADDALFERLTADAAYQDRRASLARHETTLLRALGFQTRVSLPYTLAVNYLQTLGAFQNAASGRRAAARAVALLNQALLSPQLLFLTHQPFQLATAAVYLACRQTDVKLPELDWWLVFDTDREELGFLVMALTSVEAYADAERRRWAGRSIPLTHSSVLAAIDGGGGASPMGADAVG